MTETNLQFDFLRKLTANRASLANALEQPALRGVQRSVVDKYSDQAHFIYELLQNADDAKAKKAKFILREDGLIFIHSGSINFTVSDPDTEDTDTKQRKLGHINAITSIANSNKNESSIGKFGVGFKAVFQYTNTPHVYDPVFKFRIDRFIVPQMLDEDIKERTEKETAFYFPFDLPAKPQAEAFVDIHEKLKSLVHPILFLSNLEEVTWEAGKEVGRYSKKIKEVKIFRDNKAKIETTYQTINLFEEKEGKTLKKPVLLFGRNIPESHLAYSVGFSMGRGKKLEAIPYSAFCFFPTKENTNLKFMIQAPFLLTDSRENIKAGDDWNKDLVGKLATLAADSILLLKQIGIDSKNLLVDDDIVKIIPYRKQDFAAINSRDKISFLPFYDAIRVKLQTEVILPAKNGKYASKNQSYWASDIELTELFSDKQISELMELSSAKWVFTSFGRKQIAQTNDDLLQYIDGGDERRNVPSNLIITNLDPEKLLRKISAGFIEHQTNDWLKSFYTYLLDRRSLWEKENSVLRNRPIFIDAEGKAVSAFEKDGKNLTLFLPTSTDTEYKTINKKFFSHKVSMKFFESFGITKPRLKDEIFNKIIPVYEGKLEFWEEERLKAHTLKFFSYFPECHNNQVDDYIKLLSGLRVWACISSNKKERFYLKASECYYPTADLLSYFETKPDTPFIDLSFYSEIVGEKQFELFRSFLLKLGVRELPIIYQNELNLNWEQKRAKGLTTNTTRYSRVYDKYIDGSKELIQNISRDRSFLLWRILCSLIKQHNFYWFKRMVQGRHEYFYSTDRSQEFNSTEYLRLLGSKWLVSANGDMSFPIEISVQEMAEEYDLECSEANELVSFLDIENKNENLTLTSEQRIKYDLGERLLKEGFTEADLGEILSLLKQRKTGASESNSISSTDSTKEVDPKTGNGASDGGNDENSIDEDVVGDWVSTSLSNVKKKIADENVAGSIPTFGSSSEYWVDDEQEPEENAGDLVTTPIIGNQYKESSQQRKKEQLEKEIEVEDKRQRLIELASTLEKYSFGWFKTLLELEDNFTAEERLKKNPIRVVFGKAEMDTDGFLLLTETPFIPPAIEDLGTISLQIFIGDEKITIEGEIISPQKNKLKIKPSRPEQLLALDLRSVTRVVVQSSSPDFILERLKIAFSQLDFVDSDNLKDPKFLPNDLRFVFGPPGTGKTSYLSWLIGGKNKEPLTFAGESVFPYCEQKNKRILVLTPTNKAADVIAERILANYALANDYPDWLIRFGSTVTLDKSEIFVSDRNLKKWVYSKVVLVTTIARYPYDYFNVENNDENDTWYLKEFNWDVVVFDEASMIQQAALLFVIYYARKANPNVEFVIGGDPFQIPPIFQFEFPFWSYLPEPAVDDAGNPLVDENGNSYSWKNDGGNIYSFVGLTKDDSFKNPQTEPHRFKIQNLQMQFRSVTAIGELFSKYRYNGELKHFRTPELMNREPKHAVNSIVIDKLPLSALNIIHFPVKKYGGVYKQNSMKGSPYHIYSAIFAVELVRYIQSHAVLEPNRQYKIGIISPYAKQNLLISKLLEKVGRGKIDITTGTVHGFQGDQCDLVIVIFNPPKNISRSPRSFLNKKNIINVAISRAQDKMIIFTPYDPDKEIDFSNLHQIKRVKWLAKNSPECNGSLTEFNAIQLEQNLWESATYIEDNCATSSHQEVNIYTQATKKYEIRFDENAMDVQVKPGLYKNETEIIYSSVSSENIEVTTN